MKWILCGKNDAAIEALELLVARGDRVHVVGIAGDDGSDGWQRSLRRAAGRLGVPFEQPTRINHPDVVRRLAALEATALISIQYDQILHGEILRAVGCPALNFHFALLPRHRGVSPIAWAVMEGDAEAGVTLHHMVETIDAGAVIAQRRVPIRPADTAREVYDRVSQATVELFHERYPFPPAALAARVEQDHGRACYHRAGDFDFAQRRIDWRRPADELHRWIRAMIFPPMQYPELVVGDRAFSVRRVSGEIGAGAGAPGRIVTAAPGRLVVAAAGGTITITDLEERARPGMPADEVLASLMGVSRLD